MSVFTFEAAQHEALVTPPPACPRACPPLPLPQDDSPVTPLAPGSQQARPPPAVHQAMPLAQHLLAQKYLLPARHRGTAVKCSQTAAKHAASHAGPSIDDQPFHCSGPLRSACTELGCQPFVSLIECAQSCRPSPAQPAAGLSVRIPGPEGLLGQAPALSLPEVQVCQCLRPIAQPLTGGIKLVLMCASLRSNADKHAGQQGTAHDASQEGRAQRRGLCVSAAPRWLMNLADRPN